MKFLSDCLYFLAQRTQSTTCYCALMVLLLTRQLCFNGIFDSRRDGNMDAQTHTHLKKSWRAHTQMRGGVVWKRLLAFPRSLRCWSVITFNQSQNKRQYQLLFYWQNGERQKKKIQREADTVRKSVHTNRAKILWLHHHILAKRQLFSSLLQQETEVGAVFGDLIFISIFPRPLKGYIWISTPLRRY